MAEFPTATEMMRRSWPLTSFALAFAVAPTGNTLAWLPQDRVGAALERLALASAHTLYCVELIGEPVLLAISALS